MILPSNNSFWLQNEAAVSAGTLLDLFIIFIIIYNNKVRKSKEKSEINAKNVKKNENTEK